MKDHPVTVIKNKIKRTDSAAEERLTRDREKGEGEGNKGTQKKAAMTAIPRVLILQSKGGKEKEKREKKKGEGTILLGRGRDETN